MRKTKSTTNTPKSVPPRTVQGQLPLATVSGNRGWLRFAAPLLLVALGLLAYSNTFDVPLLFDDLDRIENNPAIRTPWPVWVPMSTTNRPLGTYTFAINYALHGYRVWGYHAVNLAIHLAAGLLLLGIARHTLTDSWRTEMFRRAATPLALAIALVWLVHPLETESVTYIIQRLESLMALCYLATLYGMIRAQHSTRPGWWYAGSVVACAVGMGTKEVMATAPLLVLMYDRVFIGDGWRNVFSQRWKFYLGLSSTWGVLAWSMLHWQDDYSSGLIGATDQLGPLCYLLSQAGVLLHYLRMCFWPVGQCLDYAWPASQSARDVAIPLLVIGLLLGATAWSLLRRSAWGFLGGCFFLLLAPTSSIVPIHDLAVEHRMYLPSAAVIAAAVLAAYAGSELVTRRMQTSARSVTFVRLSLTGGTILALAALTYQRNEVYRSPLSLWRDTLVRAPHNARAYCNLGEALCQAGELDEAQSLFAQAAKLEPRYALAQYNLGTTYYQLGRYDEAVDHLQAAIDLKPRYAEALNNLGLVFCQRRQTLDGIGYLFEAVEIQPDNAKFQNALGTALDELGEHKPAIEHLQRAVEIAAADASAQYNLANALLADKQYDAALRHYRRTLEIEPAYEMAAYVHFGLGNAFEATSRSDQAVSEYQQTISLKPDHLAAHCRLGHLLNAQGRTAEAIALYRHVLEVEPGHAAAARALRLAEAGTDAPTANAMR